MKILLDSIGRIGEYNVIEVGKKIIKKDVLFEEIENYDSNVKEQARKIINEASGVVYAIIKNDKIKGISLFKEELKNDVKILKHIKTVYTDEISTEVREEYNILILEQLKDYVSLEQYDKVIFDDKVIQIDSKASKTQRNLARFGGFIIGFMFTWIIFKKFYLGLLYGFILSNVFSGLEVIITNKRGRKKKDNK